MSCEGAGSKSHRGGESIGPADGLDETVRGSVPCDLQLPGQVLSEF